MLRRILFMMVVCGSFTSLVPSSAAADIKEKLSAGHGPSAATATQLDPAGIDEAASKTQSTELLMLPGHVARFFEDAFGIALANEALLNTNIYLINWFREHPLYINAYVQLGVPLFGAANPPMTVLEASAMHYDSANGWSQVFIPVFLELIALKALPTDALLSSLCQGMKAQDIPTAFSYITQTIDLMVHHGIPLTKIQSVFALKQREISLRGPEVVGADLTLSNGALFYLKSLAERNKLRAAALRESLDPILPPVLQQITVDYAVPNERAATIHEALPQAFQPEVKDIIIDYAAPAEATVPPAPTPPQ